MLSSQRMMHVVQDKLREGERLPKMLGIQRGTIRREYHAADLSLATEKAEDSRRGVESSWSRQTCYLYESQDQVLGIVTPLSRRRTTSFECGLALLPVQVPSTVRADEYFQCNFCPQHTMSNGSLVSVLFYLRAEDLGLEDLEICGGGGVS